MFNPCEKGDDSFAKKNGDYSDVWMSTLMQSFIFIASCDIFVLLLMI